MNRNPNKTAVESLGDYYATLLSWELEGDFEHESDALEFVDWIWGLEHEHGAIDAATARRLKTYLWDEDRAWNDLYVADFFREAA